MTLWVNVHVFATRATRYADTLQRDRRNRYGKLGDIETYKTLSSIRLFIFITKRLKRCRIVLNFPSMLLLSYHFNLSNLMKQLDIDELYQYHIDRGNSNKSIPM